MSREGLIGIYRDLDRELKEMGAVCEACGRCCRLASFGHELWLTDVELAYLIETRGVRAPREPGVCPYLESGACTAREGRALGCRIFFCSIESEVYERLYERYLERIQALCGARGREVFYGELLAGLSEVVDSTSGSSSKSESSSSDRSS